MNIHETAALERVRAHAAARLPEARAYLERVCVPWGLTAEDLTAAMLTKPMTVNFHIDRVTNSGRIVLEQLANQGVYRSQFETGTSNGALGTDRLDWEQRIFFGAYPPAVTARPKYGALNLLGHLDGAAARFGACYLELKPEVTARCTFSYGDSSLGTDTLCTKDTFSVAAAALLRDAEAQGRLLDRGVFSLQDALGVLLQPAGTPRRLGRALDFCMEAHVHGALSLARDGAALWLDSSYQGTPFVALARQLCDRYGLRLEYIPERRLPVEAVGPVFRGPAVQTLARRIGEAYGTAYLNAAILGTAAREQARFAQLGDEATLFRLFKQLWHTLAYFG